MLSLRNKAIVKGQSKIADSALKKYQKQFDEIVKGGLKLNPLKPPVNKKRGRPKQSPSCNLLEKLQNRTADVLCFFYDLKVPFDNNYSERDIRMMKVKQKTRVASARSKGHNILPLYALIA